MKTGSGAFFEHPERSASWKALKNKFLEQTPPFGITGLTPGPCVGTARQRERRIGLARKRERRRRFGWRKCAPDIMLVCS